MLNSGWKYPSFEMRELHKKVGQLIFVGLTDSDIAEDNFVEQLWFRDDKNNLYLILEIDSRKTETSHVD